MSRFLLSLLLSSQTHCSNLSSGSAFCLCHFLHLINPWPGSSIKSRMEQRCLSLIFAISAIPSCTLLNSAGASVKDCPTHLTVMQFSKQGKGLAEHSGSVPPFLGTMDRLSLVSRCSFAVREAFTCTLEM